MKQLFDDDSHEMMMILPQWKKNEGENGKNDGTTHMKFVQAKLIGEILIKMIILNNEINCVNLKTNEIQIERVEIGTIENYVKNSKIGWLFVITNKKLIVS